MATSNAYGVEHSSFINGVPDLDPLFGLVTGTRLVVEACARRLMTPHGTLPGDPDYGYDLRQHTSARITPLKKAQMKGAIVAELTKEERVASAAVVAFDIDAASNRLKMTIAVVAAGGDFQLTIAVDQLTVQILHPTS